MTKEEFTLAQKEAMVGQLQAFFVGVSDDSVPCFGVNIYTKELVAPDFPEPNENGFIYQWTPAVRHELNLTVIRKLGLQLDPLTENDQEKSRILDLVTTLAREAFQAIQSGMKPFDEGLVWDSLNDAQKFENPTQQALQNKYLEILSLFRNP